MEKSYNRSEKRIFVSTVVFVARINPIASKRGNKTRIIKI